jgi:hypothetical protein
MLARDIEVLNVKAGVSVLLISTSVTDCSQNQTAVSDTLQLLSDFYHDQGRPTIVNVQCNYYKIFYIAELVQLAVLTAHYGVIMQNLFVWEFFKFV